MMSRSEQQQADVEQASRQECMDIWRTEFGSTPPKFTSVQFMRRALTYERQCDANGRLSVAVRRTLRSIISKKKTLVTAPPSSLSPGTVLLREWNGRNYQVEVIKNGFVMDNIKYKSLTAIAKRITGAHWSGPRFFGLVQ